MNILLPLILCLSWLTIAIAPAGRLAIEDEQKGVPDDKKRGTSICPTFPVIPLILWGIAWILDRVISPWGARIFITLHLVLFIFALFILIRDITQLRKFKKAKATN